MTEDQLQVFEALRRGRLICPFRQEMLDLQKIRKYGVLTQDEERRLAVLEAAYEVIKTHDAAFNAAMKSMDYEAALPHAKAGFIVANEVM